MKWALIFILGLFSALVSGVLALVLTIFFRPELILNQRVLEFALERAQVLDHFELESFQLEHGRQGLWKRQLRIKIQQFNFSRLDEQLQVHGKLETFDLSFELKLMPILSFSITDSVNIDFTSLELSLPASTETTESPPLEEEFDLEELTGMLWQDFLPPLTLTIERLSLELGELSFELPIRLERTDHRLSLDLGGAEGRLELARHSLLLELPPSRDSKLWELTDVPIEHFGLELRAGLKPAELTLKAQLSIGQQEQITAELVIPSIIRPTPDFIYQLKSVGVEINSLQGLLAFVTPLLPGPMAIPKDLEFFDGSVLLSLGAKESGEGLDLLTQLTISNREKELELPTLFVEAALPQRKGLAQLEGEELIRLIIDDLLSELVIDLKLDDLRQLVDIHYPGGGELIPAPFNQMSGRSSLRLTSTELPDKTQYSHLLQSQMRVNLSGANQYLDFGIDGKFPFEPHAAALGPASLELAIERFHFDLPRISPRSRPPQLVRDQRFITRPPAPPSSSKEAPAWEPPPISLHLKTDRGDPLVLRSHLLDEPIRLLLDIHIDDGNLAPSTVELLPLKTTIFRRPISISQLVIKLDDQQRHLQGVIEFHLPSYHIRYLFEGHPDQLQSYFESTPPLPIEDIYSVLLFGRPMNDLGMDDQEAANRSMQILSQGLFSLTTLYFFAGSPVESLGYNPDRSEVYAQFGLGERSSLRVTSGPDGGRSAGVRRTLGRGWYLDTSIEQDNHESPLTRAVLLERIIAY